MIYKVIELDFRYTIFQHCSHSQCFHIPSPLTPATLTDIKNSSDYSFVRMFSVLLSFGYIAISLSLMINTSEVPTIFAHYFSFFYFPFPFWCLTFFVPLLKLCTQRWFNLGISLYFFTCHTIILYTTDNWAHPVFIFLLMTYFTQNIFQFQTGHRKFHDFFKEVHSNLLCLYTTSSESIYLW